MRRPIVALVLAAGLANATFATPTQAGRVRHGATLSAPGAEGVLIHRRGRGATLRAPGAERIVIHRDNRGRRVVKRN